MNRDIFRTRLMVLRKRAGLTQAAIAAQLGMSRSSYTCYETGVTIPTVPVLCDLAELFDVSADYLLGRKEDPAPYHFDEPEYAEVWMAMSDEFRRMDKPRRKAARMTMAALGNEQSE